MEAFPQASGKLPFKERIQGVGGGTGRRGGVREMGCEWSNLRGHPLGCLYPRGNIDGVQGSDDEKNNGLGNAFCVIWNR